MLIKREILEAIRRGEIDLQFRRWTRPSVKAGGTLKTSIGLLQIGRVDEVDPDDVTDAEAKRAGLSDVAGFRRWLDTMKQGPLFHRIEVSYLGEDPRHALSETGDLSAQELQDVVAALERLDGNATSGAWTGGTLSLIASNPGRRAEELAAEAGAEKQPFKARVRKLKALGLIISLETGYRLSPRGEAVHAFRTAGQQGMDISH
ncbi:MAG TPA: hypothetical protein VGN80_18470 [Devosiaceae bacterium]|nr:hypothetical protein [Devosiaceae bacterium]